MCRFKWCWECRGYILRLHQVSDLWSIQHHQQWPMSIYTDLYWSLHKHLTVKGDDTRILKTQEGKNLYANIDSLFKRNCLSKLKGKWYRIRIQLITFINSFVTRLLCMHVCFIELLYTVNSRCFIDFFIKYWR